MANDPLVHLKLQHGANYTDLRSGKRWTTNDPVQSVPRSRAEELLRETLPLYQGDASRTARRFAAVPAPAPVEPRASARPAFDDGAERSAEEIDAEIEAAARAQSTTQSAAPPSSERNPASPGDRTEPAGGGRPPRARLPKSEGDANNG